MAVVRTSTTEEARRQCEQFLAGGIQLLEITFSVPDALELTREMLRVAPADACVGMGTVTTAARAEQAVAAGAAFVVSPNCSAQVAEVARRADRYLVLGSLTPTEIVQAHELGADLVKVYPLPPVGGAQYLQTIRGPLSEIPMLAGGGFDIDEIPAYRQAGATAFGIGAPLCGGSPEETHLRVARALDMARGVEQ
jgi:2-dehydro-3-deoxyphosphogluconate aldolase/(4S)-4-hydroxy-2-oxoglutarate aldolase